MNVGTRHSLKRSNILACKLFWLFPATNELFPATNELFPATNELLFSKFNYFYFR